MSVDVVFVNHTADHEPGDRVSVHEDEARRLVESAMARYATKTDAKEAGGDPEQSVTAKK